MTRRQAAATTVLAAASVAGAVFSPAVAVVCAVVWPGVAAAFAWWWWADHRTLRQRALDLHRQLLLTRGPAGLYADATEPVSTGTLPAEGVTGMPRNITWE